MSRAEAFRRGRALREQYRNLRAEFNHPDFHQALLTQCQDLATDLLEGLVSSVADAIDKAATEEQDLTQTTLFDLGGEYKLGGGRRIAKRHAHVDQMERSLAIAR